MWMSVLRLAHDRAAIESGPALVAPGTGPLGTGPLVAETPPPPPEIAAIRVSRVDLPPPGGPAEAAPRK